MEIRGIQPSRTIGIKDKVVSNKSGFSENFMKSYKSATKEELENYIKDIKKKGENAKVAIRNIRREANDAFKKMNKASEISDDEVEALEQDVQKLTDKYVANIEKTVEDKTKEIMTV